MNSKLLRSASRMRAMENAIAILKRSRSAGSYWFDLITQLSIGNGFLGAVSIPNFMNLCSPPKRIVFDKRYGVLGLSHNKRFFLTFADGKRLEWVVRYTKLYALNFLKPQEAASSPIPLLEDLIGHPLSNSRANIFFPCAQAPDIRVAVSKACDRYLAVIGEAFFHYDQEVLSHINCEGAQIEFIPIGMQESDENEPLALIILQSGRFFNDND